MSTIDYQLNILRDTQMVQRRLLEKQFPYIDWARMPFSSYGDFFRLRGIIDDCGAVWTNAYGRSNTEPDGQRNFLEDYSGNGRDIELFNFGYSKQSGYNGYVQDFRTWSDTDDSATINRNESTIEISNNTAGWVVALWNVSTNNTYINKQWTIDLHIISSTSSYISLLFFDNNSSQYKAIQLNEGRNVIQPLTDEEYTKTNFIRINCNAESHVVITQIPEYLGALVSDGIDDYGQCVKDFALPDDYTVVAMRELLADYSGALIVKATTTGNNAFLFEVESSSNISYGQNTVLSNGATRPKLFSYQTKSQYNNVALTPGTSGDTESNKLSIFHTDANVGYKQAALYSFGIFTRTLTEEELRVVENCMYAEWIAMTGKLDDIEYYDILDARFRSNEEDADKRNRWVGRLGKLHMTLHNYAFSGNSGWNGETGEDGKPLYGGALVSDGVDDYAVSDETISEEIGGFVCYAEKYGEKSNAYAFDTNNNESRLYAYADAGNLISGTPDKSGQVSPFFVLSRNPASPAGKLLIGSNNTNIEFGDFALYQLRLIKSQPTDVQLEAIKWQCRKEHEDYLIHMGWKEVE